MKLMKFSEEEFLYDFVKNGRLYINTVEFFRRAENDRAGMFDRHELAGRYHQHHGAKVILDGYEFKVAQPFFVNQCSDYFTHICCFYALHEKSMNDAPDECIFDDRVWEMFGDTMIYINQTKKFLNILYQKFNEKGFGFRTGLVEYFDPLIYDGEVGAFRKRSSYAYQSEFRIALQAFEYEDKAIDDFYLGNMESICSQPMHRSKSINRIKGDVLYL